MKKLSETVMLLCCAAMLTSCAEKAEEGWNREEYERILSEIVCPTFPEKTVNIVDLGAVGGDSTVFCTDIINDAIDGLSAEGGGTVEIPAGDFYTGAIELKSNVRLNLAEGARLRFSTEYGDYLPVVQTRWEGMDCMNYRPLIYANGAENIAITGKGTIDGRASREVWWPWKGSGKNPPEFHQYNTGRPRLFEMAINHVPIQNRVLGEGGYLRPQLINMFNCRNVLIEDVTLENSPFWIVHPLFCKSFIFRNVKEYSDGPNSDGIDPESCKGVLIEGCDFYNGDDCIAIKSGRNEDGRAWNIPSEDIIIRNCVMHRGHGAITIGSEITGGARNIFAHDCVVDSEEARMAIRFKSNTCRGGVIENVYIRDIDVKECGKSAIMLDLVYEPKEVGERGFYPMMKNISITGVNVGKADTFLTVAGIEEKVCVEDVLVKNCKASSCNERTNVSGQCSNLVIKDIEYGE